MQKFLALVVAAVSVFAAGEHSGRRAPSFALPDLNLNYHDILDHRGKVVIIDIMQTTCPHCLEVSKNLEEIKKKFGARVTILSIVSPPDNQQTVGRYLQANKFTTPILFDCGQVSAIYVQATPQKPQVQVPHVFLIDPQGMIRNDYSYNEQTQAILTGEGLHAEVQKLLGPASPAAKKSAK